MNLDSPLTRIQTKAFLYGSWLTWLFLFANYFSTGVTTVLSVLLGLFWLASGQLSSLPVLLKNHRVALSALLLYLCFIAATFYSSADKPAITSMLGKYRELLYIPILLTFFSSDSCRKGAWYAFIAASVISLIISYLKFFGALPLNRFGDPSIKSHITHSLLIAYFAFYCAHKVLDNGRYAKAFLALFLICVHNQFFAVEGRTGQAVFIVLIMLFTLQRFHKKQLIYALLVLGIALALFVKFSDKAERINQGINETQTYMEQTQNTNIEKSPMGQRYRFWQNSLKLIAEKPVFGHGTGSFTQEYARIAQGEKPLTHNPHNEFLMIGVQLGVWGLVFYLGFLGSQYYLAREFATEDKQLAQGLLTALIVTSLFNSPILDNTEGHWFATLIALCYSAKHYAFKTSA